MFHSPKLSFKHSKKSYIMNAKKMQHTTHTNSSGHVARKKSAIILRMVSLQIFLEQVIINTYSHHSRSWIHSWVSGLASVGKRWTQGVLNCLSVWAFTRTFCLVRFKTKLKSCYFCKRLHRFQKSTCNIHDMSLKRTFVNVENSLVC